MALKFSDGNIETYFSQDKLVVIDFWASWCAHCKLWIRSNQKRPYPLDTVFCVMDMIYFNQDPSCLR